MSNILKATGLVKIYKERSVVNGVDLEVKPGEIVGLLGPNGAGKTTTFYMVVGLVKPDNGSVFLGEKNITEFPMFERAKLGLSYLPQEASVFRKLSVKDNILSVIEILDEYKDNKKKQKDKLDSLIEELGLAKITNSMAYSLSGGERRRVEIARALACSPSYILLDEPFAGIDPIIVSDLQDLVTRLSEKGIGVLITDHNVRETLGICGRAYILSNGKVIESGTPSEIANSDLAKKYYLGERFSL